MRALWWLTTLMVAGCIEEMEPGSPFEAVVIPPCECPVCPEVEEEPATVEAPEEPAEEESVDAPTTAEPEEEESPGDPFQQAFQEEEESAPEEEVAATTTGWPEGLPTTAGWGVRLISIVPGAVPPQAVLGFSDGTTLVAKAGDLIPAAGLVVVAIGVERVQVVQVTPAGDHATIESKELSSMYPSRP